MFLTLNKDLHRVVNSQIFNQYLIGAGLITWTVSMTALVVIEMAKSRKPELKKSNTMKWTGRAVLAVNLLSSGALFKGILSINTKIISDITKQPNPVLSLSAKFAELLRL